VALYQGVNVNANDLADRLEQFYTGTHVQKAAEELRRLQAENDELKEKNLILVHKLQDMNGNKNEY
jgi:FtsZ-binding cell division protein ZapB